MLLMRALRLRGVENFHGVRARQESGNGKNQKASQKE
jgi:hypothetical protein